MNQSTINLKKVFTLGTGVLIGIANLVLLRLIVLFSPFIFPVIDELKKSSSPDAFAFGSLMIIFFISILGILCINSIALFGIWKAYKNLKEGVPFSWLQKISLFVGFSISVCVLLFSFFYIIFIQSMYPY